MGESLHSGCSKDLSLAFVHGQCGVFACEIRPKQKTEVRRTLSLEWIRWVTTLRVSLLLPRSFSRQLLICRLTGKVRTGPRVISRKLEARLYRLTLQQKASRRVPLTA